VLYVEESVFSQKIFEQVSVRVISVYTLSYHSILQIGKLAKKTRGDDSAALKKYINQYPAPVGTGLLPPISMTEDKSMRGFNHPQLARLLCPVKYLGDFDMDPSGFREQVNNREVRITHSSWPAFMYDNYNPEDIVLGFLHGYYLLRVGPLHASVRLTNKCLLQVFRHIFTGPNSAMQAEVTTVTRRNNARIHGMKKVSPANIAYAAVQVRVRYSILGVSY